MTSTLAAITAAGVVYDRADYSDPKLDGPTALTVTADGRVFGHLATWGKCHIGFGDRCVTAPSSTHQYQYFHQGVVPTKDGDLPVGKLTLGTGHAALGEGAMAAAAHYDNTGSTVATVRAGEDEHGIWLAGRIVPGTPDDKVAELRRSGVSGDWRGIDGSLELVAALAVNVPGFPVPRTEQLVASGVETLVAAGVVAPADPVTADNLADLVASAVDKRVAAHRRRDAVVQRVRTLVASAAADRRARVTADVDRVAAAVAADQYLAALTASADSGIKGHLPKQLRDYWTKGAGLARWAESPHPYTALTRALRKELPAQDHHMVNGLAANLFKDVFGIYPGQRKELAAAGSERRVRSMEGAKRFGVSIGDVVPKALLEQAADAADSAGETVADFLDPDRKKKSGDDEDAEDDDKKIPSDAPAPRTGGSGPLEEDQVPATGARGGKLVAFVGGIAYYSDGTKTNGSTWSNGDAPAEAATADDPLDLDTPATPSDEVGDDGAVVTDVPPRKDVGAGTDHPMEEDEAPDAGAEGGALTEVRDGKAYYDDGTFTDGEVWGRGTPPDDDTLTASAHARVMALLGFEVGGQGKA